MSECQQSFDVCHIRIVSVGCDFANERLICDPSPASALCAAEIRNEHKLSPFFEIATYRHFGWTAT